MKNIIIAIGIISLLFLGNSCSDDSSDLICNDEVIIDKQLYLSAPTDQLDINSIEIIKNCLVINFSSSGCNGDSWEIKLIDSGDIMESNPPQRNLLFSLKNEELCDAYLTKEISFDINSLKVNGNKVYLNIVNTEDQILFEY